MGFLSNLFGGGIEKQIASLSDTVDMLNLGIFKYLYTKKYAALGKDEAPLLGMAVFNTMALQQPGNEKAKIYSAKNKEKILHECSLIKDDDELCGPAGGLSYHYGSRLFMLSGMAKSPKTSPVEKPGIYERMQNLENQAERFSIWVPGITDICPSKNSREAVSRLRSFAVGYVKR